MGCDLITRTVLGKGVYQTTHEVGSLARVLGEAQAIVAKARDRVSTPDVRIDKRTGEEPLQISVILRTARANQVIALFHAVRGPSDERLPPAAPQAADPNATEASLRDFILGSSTLQN
jgi:hypothetical protein